MQLESFRGPDLPSAIRRVRAVLGDDAMIVRTHVLKQPGGDEVEVVAASPEAMAAFQRKLDGGRAAAKRALTRSRIGPYRIALVGPPGAGKTTTAVKLALHPEGLGGRRVGLVTLDTYRAGAVEELQTYAEIANLPLEVVYASAEVPTAMERLRDRDVVVVDTPGRWSDDPEWLAALNAIDADEIHLVLPAGLRHDVARRCRERMAAANPTHVLYSKLDELPGDLGLAVLADTVGLPIRWITDGHDIPGAFGLGEPRIMGSLGRRPTDPGYGRMAG